MEAVVIAAAKNDKRRQQMYNVRKYIRYVKQRVCYAELSLIDITEDEYHFYKFIRDNICKYINEISILPAYWFGKVSVTEYCTQMNIRSERTIFRKLKIEYERIVNRIFFLEKMGGNLWKQ